MNRERLRAQMLEQFSMCMKLVAAALPAEQAMIIPTVYDPWKAGVQVKKDAYITHGVNGVGDPQLYKVNQQHTTSALYPPGSLGSEALYTAIGLDNNGYPVWAQPTGAHDDYDEGDIVNHEGELWISKINGNVYVPGTDDRWWVRYEA